MPTTSATVKRPLFLRSLQLLGFKTFARPTEIRFEGGVTAIVGPNGSGKTNIVDSIKWVLGSGQARDLKVTTSSTARASAAATCFTCCHRPA
ncbi:MAG: hypothetical protein E6I77_03105 [Chloroflexi bacterium]|nr:MAG: hypothetical protein E6I77_03105 [Chloroflexota bacterium]